MFSLNEFWLPLLAGAVTGVLSGFGVGGGTLLLVYMTAFAGLEQQTAQGINLLYFLPAALLALPSHLKNGYLEKPALLPAIAAGLELLKPGGVMSLCIYHGRENGTAERDAILAWLPTVDNRRYTVIRGDFTNRTGDVPIPVFIIKE